MAVAFDAVSNGNVSISTTPITTTWSHTASGSDRVVLVSLMVSVAPSTMNYSNVTYGGAAMTLLARNDAAASGVAVYALANPPTGASTVSFTAAYVGTSGWIQYAATSYTGVDAGIGTATTGSTPPSDTHTVQSVTPGYGATYIAFAGYNDVNPFPYGAAYAGTYRLASPSGLPWSAIMDNTSNNFMNYISWNSYGSTTIFNYVAVLLKQVSVFNNGTPAKLTNTTYTQSGTYSGASPATYQYMNDGSASGGSANGNQTATNQSANAYVQADCGALRNITHIVYGYDSFNNVPGGWGTGYSTGVKIQGSTDGSTWTDVATIPSYESTGSVNGLASFPVYANYRYMRLFNTSYFPVTEFQVWVMPAPASGFFAMFN